MTSSERTFVLLLVVLGFAIPAHANNPPQPDGLFSVLLIFPVVILGCRLAGLALKPKRLATRIISWIAVAVCSLFFLGAGTIFGAFAALVVLIYAVTRSVQMIQKGQNPKRSLIGFLVITFSLFALVDYWLSITFAYPSPEAAAESAAVSGLRSLSTAESEFAKLNRGTGTLKDLENAKLIDSTFSDGRVRKGYRYREFVDSAKTEYVFYAIPVPELRHRGSPAEVLPGFSLIRFIFRIPQREGTGFRSFSVDRTGVIRESMRPDTEPLSQDTASKWEPL
jgi:hypothetical protein